jgi:hypothetical protein
MYDSVMKLRYTRLLDEYEDSLIRIPCGDISPIHFEITIEERKAMIAIAVDAATDFLFTPSLTKPQKQKRRFSAS